MLNPTWNISKQQFWWVRNISVRKRRYLRITNTGGSFVGM
jgi:hypothetical protein